MITLKHKSSVIYLIEGQQKKSLSGFSSVQVLPHTGYIFYSDVVKSVPPDLRRKVARIVAGNLNLLSRDHIEFKIFTFKKLTN